MVYARIADVCLSGKTKKYQKMPSYNPELVTGIQPVLRRHSRDVSIKYLCASSVMYCGKGDSIIAELISYPVMSPSNRKC